MLVLKQPVSKPRTIPLYGRQENMQEEKERKVFTLSITKKVVSQTFTATSEKFSFAS